MKLEESPALLGRLLELDLSIKLGIIVRLKTAKRVSRVRKSGRDERKEGESRLLWLKELSEKGGVGRG